MRQAALKIAHRPNAKYLGIKGCCVVIYKGRVICRARHWEDCEAFVAGWRQAA